MKKIDIISAIRNPKLFGALFRDLTTWASWIVWLKAVFGLAMDENEAELYRRLTGRASVQAVGFKESYAIVGRRGGKSRIVAFAAVYIACFHDFRKYLSAGERGMVLILARDRDQARVVFGYVKGILEAVAALKQMVARQTADEIELENRITISVKTSDYRAVRGVTVVCAICDEVCFWDSQGVNPDKEVLSALRPAMATVPESKLLVISSPYAKYGVVFEAYHRHYGQESNVLVWQAPTTVMNPNITAEFVQAEIEADPDAARSEWLAEFREDIEQAFSLESIEQCVVRGRTELLPAKHLTYVAFTDPSGGRHDNFTVAVAHRSGDKAVVDCLKAWKPPFNPSEVVRACVEAIKPYRVTRITGDNYGGEWPVAEFAKHRITYELSQKHRSELYLELIPALNSKRVELPDDRRLIDELRRLERRRGRSGKDTIDHPAYGGSDDQANSVAGAVGLVLSKLPLSEHAEPTGVGTGLGFKMQREFDMDWSKRGPFTEPTEDEEHRPHGGRTTFTGGNEEW
jgi:hypothetical protein